MIIKYILPTLLVLIIGGIGYLAFADIPVTQQTVTTTLSNEQFE